ASLSFTSSAVASCSTRTPEVPPSRKASNGLRWRAKARPTCRSDRKRRKSEIDVLDNITARRSDHACNEHVGQDRHQYQQKPDEGFKDLLGSGPQLDRSSVKHIDDCNHHDGENSNLPQRQALPIGLERRNDLAERPLPD